MTPLRFYPRSYIAKIAVWLLDRLPVRVRDEVLSSYWSHADIARMNERADELEALFGKRSDGGEGP